MGDSERERADEMATMLSDYNNMDVEGADMKRGAELLMLKDGAIMAIPGVSFIVDGILNTSVCSLVPMHISNPTLEKIKEYNRTWESVPSVDRRDVIAALRMAVRCGKCALTAAKLVTTLA